MVAPDHREQEVVPLDAGGGEAQGKILLAVALENFLQGGFVQIGPVVDGNFLSAPGDEFVIGLDNGSQAVRQTFAGFMHRLGRGAHPGVEYGHEVPVQSPFLEHSVALGKQAVVCLDSIEIAAVHLREDAVGEPAALLPRLTHQGSVAGRNHHDRKDADMLGNPGIGLFVPDQLFFPVRHLD